MSAVSDPTMKSPRLSLIGGALLVLLLSGCDMVQQRLGLEDPAAKAARTDAEGKAVGGACRQSGRAIEDCYSIYSWLPKAPIYEGWRDMDAYMRENKLETITPQLPPPPPPEIPGKKKKKASTVEGETNGATTGTRTGDASGEKAAEKPAEKPADKAAEKR